QQIVELQEIFEELRQAQERRRIFRDYKKRLRAFSCALATQDRLPTRAEVMDLLALMESSPLVNTASAKWALDSLTEVFKTHPHLAGDEYINCRYMRHLLATDFADEFYLANFFESLQIRHARKTPKVRFRNGYAVDFPKLVAISGSIFC